MHPINVDLLSGRELSTLTFHPLEYLLTKFLLPQAILLRILG